MKYTLLVLVLLSLPGCRKAMTADEVVAAKQYCKANGMVFGSKDEVLIAGGSAMVGTVQGCIDTDGNIYPISK